LKTLVLNDIHVPFQSARWQKKLNEYINKEPPDKIVLAGDIADLYSLSTHGNKHPRWENKLDVETAAWGDWMDDLRQSNKKAEIVYLEGNHEHRWTRYVESNAPKWRNLAINWWDYMALDDFDIRLVKSGHRVPTGCGQVFYIYHGHEHKVSSRIPGGVAKRMAENLNRNVHAGHTHHHGQGLVNVGQTLRAYHEGGYGGDIRKPAFGFVAHKNLPWALGFTVYDSEDRHSPLPLFVKV